jgi:hypothetical protein
VLKCDKVKIEEWEKLYQGKIIAIDIDENNLAAVGDNLSKVGLEARTRLPGHRIFLRKVGKNSSVARLWNITYVQKCCF